ATEATWFIDPPYQHAGRRYPGQYRLNYGDLAHWCLRRRGLVIVCGGADDDWLSFDSLTGCLTKSAGLSSSRERGFVLRNGERARPRFHPEAGLWHRPRRRRQGRRPEPTCASWEQTTNRAESRG